MKFYDSFRVEIETDLNPVEQELKLLYSSDPDRNLRAPHPLEYSRDVILTALQKSKSEIGSRLLWEHLSETSFVQPELDTAIYRHIRYLPAIWHSHTFFEIICMISGTCSHYIGDQKLTMQEGDICIVAPNTMHAIEAFSDDDIIFNLELRASTFEENFFGTLSEANILSDFFKHSLYHIPSHPYLYFQTGKDQELFNFVGYAYSEMIGNLSYKNKMLNNLVAAFFIMLLRNHASKINLPRSADFKTKANVIQILNYIQENYRTIVPGELAEEFHYSDRQIQRIVRAATGTSLHDNIVKLKMRDAKKMLEVPNMTVYAVAGALGYSSVASFRQAFKKYYGKNPTAFCE